MKKIIFVLVLLLMVSIVPTKISADGESFNNEVLLEGSAYAVLDNQGNLIFFRSNNNYTNGDAGTFTDIYNNEYTGTIYSGFENEVNYPSWLNERESITTVSVASNQTIAPLSMSGWFRLCSNLTSFNQIGFDTRNVTDMHNMFESCSLLTSLDISNFNTNSLTSISQMFYNCSSLTSLDLFILNTNNALDFTRIFSNCSSLTSLNISSFDTSTVTTMYSMFDGCSSLTSLNLSGIKTNNVKDMRYMFQNCSSLTSLDLSNFNTSSVTRMDYMFCGCTSLESLNISSFNTNKASMDRLFYNCSSLVSVSLGSDFQWKNKAYLPTATWSNGTLNYSETELYNNWSSSLAGTWGIPYTITYNLDGGTNNPNNPSTYTYEDTITLLDPTKEEYSFNGWLDQNNNVVTTIPSHSTGNKTLTATWSINQYTVTFNTNGGTTIPSITQDYGTSIIAPSNPTRTGYTFAGWDKDIPSTMPANNMTINATWSINQYTVTFNTNGGTTIPSITQDYGTSIIAPSNPTRTGYTFAGWDKDIPSTMPANNMTINANWSPINYNITYNLDGGTNNSNNPSTYTYEDTITLLDPTKEGYTFMGWKDENNNTVTGIPNHSTGNKILKATWSTAYSITYNLDGGTNNPNNPSTYTYEDTITLLDPTKEGYTFTGWLDESNNIVNKIDLHSIDNKTLTATWIKGLKTFVSSGTCGDKHNYRLYDDVLIIYGTGAIPNYNYLNVPWYEYRESIKTIVIGDSITSIGDQSFISCTNLVSIDFGNSIASIGEGAFYGCSSIETIFIPNTVTSIGDGAFCECTNLTHIVLPNTITYIGEEAFEDCPNITVYVYDNSYAKNCCINSNINYIEIETDFVLDGITITPPTKLEYEYNEDLDLTGLEVYEVYKSNDKTIPSKICEGYVVEGFDPNQLGEQTIIVSYKEYSASFEVNVTHGSIIDSGIDGNITWSLYQDGLLRIEGNGNMPNYSYNYNNNKIYITCPWYQYEEAIKYVEILDGVTSIGRYAFWRCSNLTSVTISDSVVSINFYAFSDCSNLSSLTMPISTTINQYSFEGVTNLTSVTLTKGTGTGITYDSTTNQYTPWYKSRNQLTTLTLEEGITSIGEYAFSNCSNLISATIGNSVTSIGSYAFADCSNLTSLTMPISTTINQYSFEGVTNLTSVTLTKGTGVGSLGSSSRTPWYKSKNKLEKLTLEEGITSIGRYAFDDYTNLTSITIPDSVTSIGDYAFRYCSSLASIIVPDSVTSIGNYAFSNCSSLTSATIGKSVTSIGYSTFSNCSNLTSITIPDSVTSIEDYAFRYCSSLASITVPDSVTSIGNYAFSGCSNLSSLTMPISTSIDQYSFEGVTNLTSVTLTKGTGVGVNFSYDSYYYNSTSFQYTPWYKSRNQLTTLTLEEGIMSIGSYTFYDCSNLTSITIPDSVTSIGIYAFSNCSSLTSLTMPISTTINQYSFEGVTNLTSVTLTKGTGIGEDYSYIISYTDTPWYKSRDKLTTLVLEDGITYIGNYTFRGSNLTSIIIPDSVTSIGNYAFSGCSNLSSITIPDSVTYIGNYAFAYTGISSIVVPNSVTYIGDSAFRGTSITSVEIPSSVTYLSGFDYTGLTSITIPDSVTSIGKEAFYNCSSLTSITIPDSVTYIGNYAFAYTGISSIVVPNSVTYIGDGAFRGTSITSVEIPSSVTYLSGFDGTGITSINIPDSVTTIGYYAFANCSNLTSIIIPNSVTSIGKEAFYNCSSLTSITIPDSVTSIGSGAFKNCSNLTSIIIPDSVTNIEEDAFFGCTNLNSLTMPISVKMITNNIYRTAFSEVTNLTSVTLTKGTGIGTDYSYNIYSYTPWYKSRDKLTTLVLEDGITYIGNYTFRGSNLTSIIIPDSVTSIGNYAFYGCSGLTSITIPDSVTSIGTDAFSGCSSDLLLCGYENTYLQEYCLDNGLTYQELSKISNKTMSGTLKNNGTVSLTLNVEVDDGVDLDNAYALINGKKVSLDSIDSNGRVSIVTPGVAPKNINDDFVIRYYDENDNPISKEINLSVKEYIETLLNGYLNKKTKTFYKSLLNYSAYAQEYFDYDTDNLANDSLDELDKDVSDVSHDDLVSYAANKTGITEGISAYGQTLVLNNEIDYRIYFLLDGSHSIDEYTFKDNNFTLNKFKYSDTLYYVIIPKMAAPDLDKSHTITVTLNGDGNLSITSSVLTYCEITLKDEPTTIKDIQLANLMKALYKYSISAKNLLGA